MVFFTLGVVLLAVPFLLPIALWVALYRTRTRLALLEAALAEQREVLDLVSDQLAQLTARPATAETHPAAPAPSVDTAPPAEVPRRPADTRSVETPSTPPLDSPHPTAPAPPAPPRPVPPAPSMLPTPSTPSVSMPPASRTPAAAKPPVAPPVPPSRDVPPSPPRAPEPPAPSFDWEGLVGAKLFPAIAGIAIVIAAIFFLRHSAQQGWLQPPVRVLIGIAVAIALLVVCELKAARQYPTLANALDAAAIAILFATFFAAHALWNLIPALVAFALLAAVTALAVLLSLRRESLFIAVLGLLGGFATPALLSTGENRPVPLFAYLVLLNVGLAWVAYRQAWPVLTVLTLILTTMYQWGWVHRFLTASQLPTALGIFAVFPVVAVAALMFGRRGSVRGRTVEDDAFEHTTVLSAGLPLLFVAYLAAVPAYGAHPALLFGFLLLMDAGLLAIAIGLGRMSLHAVAGLATVLIWAVWLSTSYVDTRAVDGDRVRVRLRRVLSAGADDCPALWPAAHRSGTSGGIRRPGLALRLCGHRVQLSGGRVALAVVCTAARPRRVVCVARHRAGAGRALLRRVVPRRRSRSGLVREASDRRASAGGGEHLRALWHRDSRGAADRAASRASSPSRGRRGPGASRQPRAAGVPVERFDRPVRLVVARAAAGHPQRRPVHRERGSADAGTVAAGQRIVLGRPRPVVVPNGGGGRHPSQPRGRHRADADHSRRSRLGTLLDGGLT